MSRPYQFGDKEDRVTSPLDRRAAAPYAQGQAPSFKTNVNRAKTKKWVEAKAPSYGGDDWDDYDEEDEYGVEAARDAPLPPLPGQHTGRSFTQPVPPAVRNDRRNSFDAGDERRAFSSGFPLPLGPTQAPSQVHVPLHVETSIAAGKAPATDSPSQFGSAVRLPSASSDLSSTNPEHRRDFSPSALPTPLRAGNSSDVTSPTDQASSNVTQHASAADPPISTSPPPSFIRPADIYKRHLEEEQRRSLESQRQSLDSIPSQEVASPVQGRAPLESVAERKSEYGPPELPSVTAPATTSTGARSSFAGLAMPTGIGEDTGFGDEFWGSTMGESSARTATAPASNLSPITRPDDPALQHQPSLGFTSLVHQAFDTTQGVSKQDSLRSQDATDSSVSRSNTTGTSDISPIMSRVPSSATAEAKLAERREATPAIEEESEGSSRPTSQEIQSSVPTGFTPGFRRDLNTPSPNNSPARSPAVEANTQSSLHGVAAEIGSNNPAAREADIVEAIASSPDKDASLLASIEKSAQGAFVESHKSDIPDASPKITRAESPSKGRVADLAGRFDVSPARKGSVESWEAESMEGSKRSRSTSPVKDGTPISLKPVTLERPQAEREISFRPKLPGAFESYTTTRSISPVKASHATPQPLAAPPAPPPKDESGDSSDVDFTPTSAKHTVKGKDLTDSHAGPMAALAAAGAAVGEALKKSMGADGEPADSEQVGDRLRGDVYSRPAPLERLDTGASSVPPTPLPKDNKFQPLVPSKERNVAVEAPESLLPLPVRPTFDSQPSMESGTGDFESDRLRREIVRSLSPEGDARLGALSEVEDLTPARGANRTSNAIPSEYDSYWAAGDDDRLAKAAEHSPQEVSRSVPRPPSPAELRSKSTSPNYLDKRFSWEKKEDEAAAVAVLGGGAAIAAHQASSDPSAAQPALTMPTATDRHNQSSSLQPKVDVLSLNPKLSGEGLHIVNAEPGELPTPVDAAPTTPNRSSHMAPELYVPPQRELGGHSGPVPVTGEPVSSDSPTPGSPAGPRPPSGPRPKTGEEARPASFREILAIKSTPTRIAKYEETRHQFAETNTGLGNWLSRTLEAHPEHREIAAAALRPAMSPTGPVGPRHKTNASISRVFTSKDSSPASSAHVDPGAEHKSGPVSAGTGDQRASTGKSKDLGKDILKSAGVLGGKGMKEAKGLFSKGKSRFRGSGTDKDEEGHSRPRTPSSMSISSHDSRPPSSKRTSRSFSPFHRSSRPASVVLSDHPEGLSERSAFQDQRPRSMNPVQGQYWPEPASVPTLNVNPTPATLLHRSFTPQPSSSRLGILPSPSRGAFASDSLPHDPEKLSGNHQLESVIRNSTPPLSPPMDVDRTPTQGHTLPTVDANTLTPRAANNLTHHQRVVSMLQPEEMVTENDEDEPVSPISPVEESNLGGPVHDVKPQGVASSLSSPAVSTSIGSPLSLEQNIGHLQIPSNAESHVDISRDNSVKAMSSENAEPQYHVTGSSIWKEARNDPEDDASAAISDESASDSDEAEGPKEPKGKGRVYDLATLSIPGGSLESAGRSRDTSTSTSSAILEQAQTVQLQSQAILEPTRHVALGSNDRLKDGADRLAAIAEAHRKMRAQFQEDDAVVETPHDFLVADSAAKKFDRASMVQQSLRVPHQQWGVGRGATGGRPRESSITSTKTMPTAVRPSMIITEPMPDDSQRTKSLGAANGEDAALPPQSMLPLLEVFPRSTPSVSSMGQEDTKSSADQSPTGQNPPISPIKALDINAAFETRAYNPPRPNLERPMSFVPLARDPSGLPVQELISTTKHPLDLDTQSTQLEEQQHTSPSTGGIRRMSRQFDKSRSASPGGLNRMSRRFDGQEDASPKARRRSRQMSLTMGTIQNPTEVVPDQPQSSHSSTSRPLSMADADSRPDSRSLSMELQDPYRPVQLYDRPSSGASTNFAPPTNFQTLVNSNLRHGTPDVRHQGTGLQEVAPKSVLVDPIKKQGLLQKFKKRAYPAPAIPQLTIQGPEYRVAEETTPAEPQRPMSLQSRTSTVDSEEVVSKKDKKKRSSFLSGLKRPVTAGTNLEFSREGSLTQAHQASPAADQPSPAKSQYTQTVMPPSPRESRLTAGLKSKTDRLPHRALTHAGQEVPGKKRFSGLGSLFGRSGTTGHTPDTSKKLSKEQPKGTVFHRVPKPPANRAFEEQQRLQAAQWQSLRQGQHPQDLPLSPNQIVGHSGQPPPAVGYYAPVGIPPPTDQNFGHSAGVAGYDAIAAQQNRPAVSSSANISSPGGGRAGSTGSATRWLSFGRKESAGSGTLLSPQVSASSPMEQDQRHNSGGSISPVSVRRDSSPRQNQGRPPRGLRMGSITETPGQHQERPWALKIPNEQENDGDRELMRQEIFHAASARWQRGSDGQMHAVPTDQPLQSPLGSPGSPPPNFTSHPQAQAQQQFPPPANPANSYPPLQASLPDPPQVPSYRPTGSPAQSPDALRDYQPMAIPGQYQPVGIPGEYRRVGYHTPSYSPPTAPDEPQIPSLPQARLPLMQPQPTRLSYSGSPVAPAAPNSEQALEDPRLDPTFQSRSSLSANGVSTMSAEPTPQSIFFTASPLSRGVGSAPPPRGVPNLGITTNMPTSGHQLPRAHSYAQPPSQHVLYQHQRQQPREPQLAHSTSAEDLYSDPSKPPPFSDNTYTQYPHTQEQTGDVPPPPPPKDDDVYIHPSQQQLDPVRQTSLAGVTNEPAAARAGHGRSASESSDEIPVMKASGYPGDEWVPSWDGMD